MRKIFIGTLILIVLLVSIIPISYAIEMKEKSFFEVNKKEISSGETLELIINLDNVEYEKSILTISADINTEEIYNKDDNINVDKTEENNIKIELDKQAININQIKLYYDISEELEIGNTITFKAIIQNSEDTQVSSEKIISVKIAETEQENSNKNEDETKQKDNESKQEQNQEKERFEGEEKNQNNRLDNEQSDNNKQKIAENIQNQGDSKLDNSAKTSTTLKTNSSNSTNKETVTYNGSDNNYLSELSVDNYKLNKNFNKESSTYFVTVDKDVSKISINATAEDSNSIVCVTGNDNLGSGTNKVLITVTAENGNVRNYKIYVTKND